MDKNDFNIIDYANLQKLHNIGKVIKMTVLYISCPDIGEPPD
jgi:hypothetical protein